MKPSQQLIVLALAAALAACSAAITSTGGTAVKHLPPCPERPNCVNSEAGSPRQVPPFACPNNQPLAWQWLRQIITEMGGDIRREEPGYLHATFTSRLFRFVDDLELHQPEGEAVIHVRSASRTGYFDFAVNRKRVLRMHQLYAAREATARGN